VTTWGDWRKGAWYRLATVSFSLGALRLLARLLSMFAGRVWLAGFDDKLYLPAVLVVDGMLGEVIATALFMLAFRPSPRDDEKQLGPAPNW
jgi:hypothetical protein